MRSIRLIAAITVVLAGFSTRPAQPDEVDELIIRNGLTNGNALKSNAQHKIVDAGVSANTPTPAPTATPQPAPTLVPTATPQPTATLVPTATPPVGTTHTYTMCPDSACLTPCTIITTDGIVTGGTC